MTVASRPALPAQIVTPAPSQSGLSEVYYTPRGSNISIMTNPMTTTTTTSSQHLAAPSTVGSRKNSTATIIDRKEIAAALDPSGKNIFKKENDI